MPYSAVCHPDRRRKTKAGLCQACYDLDRYRSNEARRLSISAAVARWRKRTGRWGARGLPIAFVFNRDGWICYLCEGAILQDRKAPDPLSPSIDHVVPQSRGGTDEPANLRATHLGCNFAKNNRPPSEATPEALAIRRHMRASRQNSWARISRTVREPFRQEVFARDGYRCRIRRPGCTGQAEEVDHIVPRAQGGPLLDLSNVRAACKRCNLGRRRGRKKLSSAGASRDW